MKYSSKYFLYSIIDSDKRLRDHASSHGGVVDIYDNCGDASYSIHFRDGSSINYPYMRLRKYDTIASYGDITTECPNPHYNICTPDEVPCNEVQYKDLPKKKNKDLCMCSKYLWQ
jgi:hypothetical protein